MSFVMSVHFKNSFFEVFLPGLNNRKVVIEIPSSKSGYAVDIPLSLEVWNNAWTILENESVSFLKTGGILSPCPLEAGLRLACEHNPSGQKFSIIVEESYESYSDFNKYILNHSCITIGSADGNSIIYNNRNLVSRKHTVIERDANGNYFVIDQKSSNSTFVNGRRILGSHKLSYGDVIYIIGLKIVYMGDLIAINQPKDPAKMEGFDLYQIPGSLELKAGTAFKDEYYQQSPRRIELLDDETIEIEAPPNPNLSRRQPLIFTIGPSMTMVIPMVTGVLFAMWSVQQTNHTMTSPFMFMGIITSVTAAFIGVFWALTNYNYNKSIERENEERRCVLFSKYLDKIRRLLSQKHSYNKEILDKKYPETHECLRFMQVNSRRLWERNVNHLDFLTIRLGRGDMISPNAVTIPKERFSLIDDALAEEPLNIKNEYRKLKEIPVCISLREHLLVGVIGDSINTCISTVHVMAAQIAAYHCYTDVKMVFIFNEKDTALFEFPKWLPHTWSLDGSLRMMACDSNGVGEVFYHLSDLLRQRLDERDNPAEAVRPLPHYVVFITDPSLVENEAVMKHLLAPTEQMGISTVLLYGQIGQLPNNCTVIIQNDNEYSGYYSLDSSFTGYEDVTIDYVEETMLSSFARGLSGVRVREVHSAGAIPEMLTFLDMYKTTRLEDIDIQRRWLENRTYESMKAIIGYRGADTPLYLDIHEKYHGPHGLVAGTTGSGKSETLQTYILSLALNYHPYEVSFILIDYKGGGMAGSFEKLPHVAGIITNLGGNQTNRALASINSEIKRRQAIFNEFKIKHIDTYIEIYRSGKATIPMPHLLIIADEFAELKKEQPEFVRELVSASRVGRSLGVHLILATQKPSGVVDDEIWGNSKFRLCLRVQDKQDSNEMIKRPDAAYITNAGRGFFQVGNDEIFEAFQSGWSGAPYEPETQYSDEKQGDVKIINLWGKPQVVRSKKTAPQEEKAKKQTQLEAVVLHIAEISEKQNIRPIDNIWLPPLPVRICLQDIEEYTERAFFNGAWEKTPWELKPAVGIVDDPVNQRQIPLIIDLLTEGHLLISGSGGKTTFLQTLLYSLVTTYSPNRFNLYIADYGSRTMGVFGVLPHVGGVVFDNETDKINKLIAMLIKELNKRKVLFSEKGIGSFKEYVRLYDDVPAIVLAVDNFAAFNDNCPMQEDNMVMLSREAASYGIYLVITCTNINDIRNKIRQNIGFGIGLQLADRFEYEEVLNEKTEITAENKIPGRGLVCYPKPLEFQTAMCLSAGDAVELNMTLKKQFDIITNSWQGKKAPVIPQVPVDMSLDSFLLLPEVAKILQGSRYLPLGYDLAEAALESIDLAKTYCYSISGTGRGGKTNLLKAFMIMAKSQGSKVYVFDGTARELESFSREIATDNYMVTSDELFDFMQMTLLPEFTRRNEGKAKFIKNGRKNVDEYLKSEQKIYLFIGDITAFCEAVYSSQRDMKGFMEQMVSRGDQHIVYLFACISQSDMLGELSMRRLMRGFVSWKEGIHLGGDVEHQRLFDFDVPVMERSKKLPSGIGQTIIDGVTKKVVTPEV